MKIYGLERNGRGELWNCCKNADVQGSNRRGLARWLDQTVSKCAPPV